MKRLPTPEMLDSDSGTASEIAASLSDLRRINRWFGGVATTRTMIEQAAAASGHSSFTLLEVAAGSGYVPQTARRQVEKQNIHLAVTLLDRSRAHLNGASMAVVGDALALPFRNGAYDLVACGLFAHHLYPEELVRFVNEALRVCRVAVLINDLIRHPAHLALVYAGYPLYRSRLTRHDAPASVRQSYTVAEMRQMLEQTMAGRVEITRRYLFRMGAIAWKD